MRSHLLATLLLLGTSGAAVAQSAPDGPPPGPSPEGRARGPGGRVFISPMGEPFHGGQDRAAPQDQWFAGADANHDGVLTSDEMQADAARFFAVLDRGHDGEIDPDDIEHYETEIAPEIRVGGMGGGEHRGAGGGRRGGRGGHRAGGMGGGGMGGGGMGRDAGDRSAGDMSGGPARDVAGKQGAARFGYLDFPEPVTAADTNMNRGIDAREFGAAAAARFALLDSNHDGKLEKSELPRITGRPGGERHRDGPPPERGAAPTE